MNMNLKEPVILVLSDAHLGALKSEFQLLYEFLRGINEEKYQKDVKAILILGDFFDICMENCSDVRSNFSYILDELIKLKNSNIPVIFSLGNHEISVTGDIETNFNKHKNDFINDFNEPSLLSEGNIGQYIEVRKDGTSLSINLYDSLKLFDQNALNIQPIPIDVSVEEKGDFKCLLTHGHQFEPKIALFFAGGLFWGRLIKSRDSRIKKFVDTLWNSVLSGYRSVLGLTKEDVSFLVNKVKIQLKEKRFVRKCIYKILKWERRKTKSKNRKYFKRISKLIKKKGRDQKLTHIVFGHTHKVEEKKICVNNKVIAITNSGTWQKICKPSYLEINLKRFEIDMKRMKLTNDLRLLRFFNKISESLGLKFRKELIEQYPEEQEKLLIYSQMEIFKTAKEKNLISQDNFDNLEKYNQYQQDYLIHPKYKIDLEEVQDKIKDLRDIYITVNQK